LDTEADHRSPPQNDENARKEAGGGAPLGELEEEEEGFAGADCQSDPGEEEDVAHGEEEAVEEQEDSQGREEQTPNRQAEPDLFGIAELHTAPHGFGASRVWGHWW